MPQTIVANRQVSGVISKITDAKALGASGKFWGIGIQFEGETEYHNATGYSKTAVEQITANARIGQTVTVDEEQNDRGYWNVTKITVTKETAESTTVTEFTETSTTKTTVPTETSTVTPTPTEGKRPTTTTTRTVPDTDIEKVVTDIMETTNAIMKTLEAKQVYATQDVVARLVADFKMRN